ncbi:hypothetical protein DB354_04470 [Opitutus sp. ER46]|nr:hypothetical protein DB354_04470 [Opitutus sp. ER46]
MAAAWRQAAAAAAVALPLISLHAQVPAAKDAPEEIVQLTPFTVTGQDDRGYQAQNSLAGTRLRTDLRDIAAPISAFTQQFLRDAAITDTSDLAGFMLSTEYDLSEDSAANMNSIKGDARPIRMRGIVLTNGTASPSVNFFKIDGRLDTFSLERLDQARGPNAILFGLGTAAGTVNATTKRARFDRNSGEVAIAGKRWGGLRTEADYNQIIIPKRLALRVAAVRDDQDSWRNFEYNNSERYFGTMKLKVAAKTEVDFEVEHGNVDKATRRVWTAYDAYTPWRDAGMPLATKATAGVQVLSTSPYIVYDTQTGGLMNWRNMTTSQKAVTADGTALVLADFSVLPRETSIVGPGFNQLKKYTRMTAFLTHQFTPDLNLEVSAFRHDNLATDFDPQLAAGLALQVDTNPKLPNGAVNPNAGRAYLEGLPQLGVSDTRDDSVRSILAYQHDFGPKLGRHSLAGVFQYNHQNYRQTVTREQVVVNPFNTSNPENNGNRVFRRTYVDLNAPSDQIVMANPLLMPSVSGLTESIGGKTVQTAWVPFNTGTQLNSNRQTSYIAALQSSWWRDRLHTVLGASRDERTDYYSTQTRTPLAPFTNGVITAEPGTVPFKNTANSFSFSGVVRVIDAVSLTYSQARNAGLPNPTGTLRTATGHPPAPKGESRDYGVKLDLFDHRLFVTATRFESGDKNDFDFTGVLAATINPIWNGLDAAGVLAANGLALDQVLDRTNGSTRDTDSEGYEVELTANPTPNWRIYANYTNSRTTVRNIGREMQDYIASNRALWEKNANVAISDTTTTARTVGSQLAVIDRAMFNQFVVQDGREPLGQMRHKFNLRTGYDFTQGPLKGITLGGAVRYNSANLIAFTAVPDADGNVARVSKYGSPQVYLDANVGYGRKFTALHRSIRWSLQLNVNNVLNNDAFVRLKENESGQLLSYRFNRPLEWIVTNRFEF